MHILLGTWCLFTLVSVPHEIKAREYTSLMEIILHFMLLDKNCHKIKNLIQGYEIAVYIEILYLYLINFIDKIYFKKLKYTYIIYICILL